MTLSIQRMQISSKWKRKVVIYLLALELSMLCLRLNDGHIWLCWPVWSIVAVHGLNPTDKENHAEKTWTADNKKLWLRDFLPESLPNARILLFGYNSNVAIKSSTAGVLEQAVNLLNRLKSRRKDVPLQRPIIFIAHSLGGLVVKRVRFKTWFLLIFGVCQICVFSIWGRGLGKAQCVPCLDWEYSHWQKWKRLGTNFIIR